VCDGASTRKPVMLKFVVFLSVFCAVCAFDIKAEPLEIESRLDDSSLIDDLLNEDVFLDENMATATRVHVLPGWCREWSHQNTGESMRIRGVRTFFSGSHVTQENCIANCNSDPHCHQAVFEASGPWGPGCWLGNRTSDIRPTQSRPCTGRSTPCVDFCYNKNGWGQIASDPSPTPANTPAFRLNATDSWCSIWRQNGQWRGSLYHAEFGSHGRVFSSRAACEQRCAADPACAYYGIRLSDTWCEFWPATSCGNPEGSYLAGHVPGHNLYEKMTGANAL